MTSSIANIPQVPLKDIDFQYFIELMIPFVEDGAVKNIYIEETRGPLDKIPRYDYNIYILYGDVSEYNKSFDVICGEMTIVGGFSHMLNSILWLTTPACRFTKIIQLKSKDKIKEEWVKLV